jgi:hypothetical protein
VSHDFAIWESDHPLENEEAAEIYTSLMQSGASDKVKPSAKIALLAKEIHSHWPKPRIGDEDESPWAAPLDVSKSHLAVFIVRSRVWDVWPILGQLAEQHELVLYDPQQEHVFLPRRLSRKRTRDRAKKKRQAD